MPSPKVTNPVQLEAAIREAAAAGILVDKRATMPRGKHPDGTVRQWTPRYLTDILGICLHQTASPNTKDPVRTAVYLTSPNNHISADPLPSVPYHFMIPDTEDPPWLTADLTWKTWAQGASTPGDENLALVAIAYMGSFSGPGWKGTAGPTQNQIDKGFRLLTWLFTMFGWDGSHLFGHYHFHKAACPGTMLQAFIEETRGRAPQLATDLEWQEALLKAIPGCLPKWGADGKWGYESKSALCRFQRANRLDCTGVQDPFTQLKLFPILYPDGKPQRMPVVLDGGGVPTADEIVTAQPMTRAMDPVTGEVGDLRDPNFVMGVPPGTFVPVNSVEPPIICAKCGADLVEGVCPDCPPAP